MDNKGWSFSEDIPTRTEKTLDQWCHRSIAFMTRISFDILHSTQDKRALLPLCTSRDYKRL